MNINDFRFKNIVFNKYNGVCAYCGIELDDSFSIDHIDATVRPSLNLSNYTYCLRYFNPCCITCNSSKSSKTLDEWRSDLENKHSICYKQSSHYRILIKFNRIIEVKEPIKFHFEKINNNA